MTRPTLPADGTNPYGDILRAAINDTSDRADAATTLATAAQTLATTANNTANSAAAASSTNSTAISSLTTSKANDSAVVHLTGNENISGTKTFNSAPGVPDGSFSYVKISNFAIGMSDSANVGGFLNATGIPYTIRINTSTGVWPNSGARIVPTGYTGPVIWDSQGYAGASAPPGGIDNDFWDQRLT